MNTTQTIGVIGTGTIGTGIAPACAVAGLQRHVCYVRGRV